jgi:transketolase
MALAPLAYRLYTRWMRHDPADPSWFDRDRLVLSIGHASMLLYASLHLAGYAVTMDDLRSFRALGSRTPGHPERGETSGIDIGTGPLGQGVANGVGFALAERMLAARFNRPDHTLVDHRTWVIAGDGDMMEGISSEAAALAGRFGLGKLTLFYDSNRISLEGATDIETSEDVAARFRANGWHVPSPVGCVNDLVDLDRAIGEAIAEGERPSFVVVHSNIGYGTPKQDTAQAHGNPLGAEAIAAGRSNLGWQHPPFEVPREVYDHWSKLVSVRAAARHDWDMELDAYRLDHPETASEFERTIEGRLPDGWESALPVWPAGTSISGRDAGGQTLNALAARLPELVGGSADVSPSTKTHIDGAADVNEGDWSAPNIHFGVREHAMGAVCNAIAAHGGLRPFCSTFFVFSDYLRPAVRMSAIMQLPVIWVMTHDSIGVGEDGPTHQPVEHLASFRAMPGLTVIRPGDANETAQAWRVALERPGPTMLVLSRQALPVIAPERVNVDRGATIVQDGGDAVLVATGSEVEVAVGAARLLGAQGVSARVVSLSSWELFRRLEERERRELIPRTVPVVAVEAGATQGWLEFADSVVGIDRFGMSAPAADVYAALGVTAAAVAQRVIDLIGGGRS